MIRRSLRALAAARLAALLGAAFAPAGGQAVESFSNVDRLENAGRESPSAAANDEPQPPTRVAQFEWMPKPVTLPDGELAALFLDHEGPGLAPTPTQQTVYARHSDDAGTTWSDAVTLLDLPAEAGAFGYFVPLVDKQGEIHLFLLCDANTGVNRPRLPSAAGPRVAPLAQQRLDVWHARSKNGRTAWTEPRAIWEGRAGDLQSATQLSSGRIILPLSYLVDRSWSNRGDGPDAFTYTGQFDTTVLYSDDGQSWQQSSSVLRTATPNLSAYGAVEPVVLELRDGRTWMLLRTQLGRFYESFSQDQGYSWSPAGPTQITSSDSPAALVRLSDGRIVMLWNNSQRHPYAQGSRHVLHAAVSRDDGLSWSGYREVLRDPYRSEPPPPNGDHGVAYPFAAEAGDGSVVYSLWVQSGTGRSLEKFDPNWLEQQHAEEDFSDRLDQWSTFGTRGVQLVAHPDGGPRKAMKLCRTDVQWPTAAVWNFPQGEAGRLRLRLQHSGGGPPLQIELTNHFSPPFDRESKFHGLFTTSVAPHAAAGALTTPPGKWVTVELDWDCTAGECLATVDGQQRLQLRQRRAGPGPSYLRLSLAGDVADSQYVFVDHVAVDVAMAPDASLQDASSQQEQRTDPTLAD